jgi:hypothetical protein
MVCVVTENEKRGYKIIVIIKINKNIFVKFGYSGISTITSNITQIE